MKKTLFFIVAVLLSSAPVWGQSVKKKPKFMIGETLPKIALHHISRGEKRKEPLDAFRGRTVILYFGDSDRLSNQRGWVSPHELQQKYNEDIQIILVQESSAAKSVLKMRSGEKRTLKDMTLPVVYKDSVLNSFYPASPLEHLVWVDPSGKLMGITGSDQLTPNNLEALATGEKPPLVQKEGVKYKATFSKPLFVKSNGGDGDRLEWQSTISKYVPGLEVTMRWDSSTVALASLDITTMVRYLFKDKSNRFGALNMLPESRVDLRVKDSAKYMAMLNGAVQRDNQFTYQLYLKVSTDPKTLRAMALSDIKRYFGIDFYWSTQRKMCLVLGASDTTKFCYKSGDMHAFVRPALLKLNDVTVKEFFDNLIAFTPYHHSPYPLIDETGLKGTMGQVDIKTNVLDYHQLAAALRVFGLTLSLEPREVKVLTIFEPGVYTPGPGAVNAN